MLSTCIFGSIEAATVGMFCMFVFVCVCVWGVRALADHKSTAVNIYHLKFLIDNNNINNIMIKPRISKIKFQFNCTSLAEPCRSTL